MVLQGWGLSEGVSDLQNQGRACIIAMLSALLGYKSKVSYPKRAPHHRPALLVP